MPATLPAPLSYLFSFLLGMAYALGAMAQPGPESQSLGTLRSGAAKFLKSEAAEQYPMLEASVEVSAPDPRLRLPSCTTIEYFLSPGSHYYGSGSIGARCESPQPWTLYLGYTIKLRGPAVTAARSLLARQSLGAQDVQVRDTEYTQAPGNYLQDPARIEGLMTRQAIAAGQALTHTMLIRPMAIRAGEKARLVAEGSGFSVSQECTALNNAREGEPVRCRVESGRIIQGTAGESGTIIVNP